MFKLGTQNVLTGVFFKMEICIKNHTKQNKGQTIFIRK